jgi:metal-responsive CopG/Arc/MetJ family transcriptional regulator
MATRIHVSFDEEVLSALDEIAGPRGRSAFIEEATRKAIERETRWKHIRAAVGSISDDDHDWDKDPADWVHDQRRADPRGVG